MRRKIDSFSRRHNTQQHTHTLSFLISACSCSSNCFLSRSSIRFSSASKYFFSTSPPGAADGEFSGRVLAGGAFLAFALAELLNLFLNTVSNPGSFFSTKRATKQKKVSDININKMHKR